MHFVIFAAEIWSFSRQHYLIMSMWRDPQLTSWETAFTNSFSCRSWHKNTFIPSSLLNSGSPSTAECSQNRSLCTVTSRLINTWSRSHLPWLPPSEQSPARSSCRWANQWARTNPAFVGHINCIPLKQNIPAPGVAARKLCERHSITKIHRHPQSLFFVTLLVSRVILAWQGAKKASEVRLLRQKRLKRFFKKCCSVHLHLIFLGVVRNAPLVIVWCAELVNAAPGLTPPKAIP